MNLKSFALGAALVLAAAAPAAAQRPGGWEFLGEERVGIGGGDHDIIRLAHNEDFYRAKSFRRLRFVAAGGELKMKAIRLNYLNGHSEDLDFNQTLVPGQEINLDLRGERSYLASIEMFYKSKFGVSFGPGGIRVNQASVKVFGENTRFAPPPPPPPPAPPGPAFGSWFDMGEARFDRTADRVDIRVGRREGRIGQIRLALRGEPVTIREVVVRFANGEVQRVPFRQELRQGDETGRIDLVGDRRFVENVTVLMEPRRRPGPAELKLLGTERPGR